MKQETDIEKIILHPEEGFRTSEILEAFNKASEAEKSHSSFPYLNNIAEMRCAAKKAKGLRLCIFAMPKSGSTFIQNTFANLFRICKPWLTTTHRNGSFIGMNAREQELDELAIIQANLVHKSYVSQHHTRATKYLDIILKNYGITPIIAIRNIPDCLVSLDDMYMKWLKEKVKSRQKLEVWNNFGGKLPLNYVDLEQEERLSHLIDTYGKWYLEFLISWKRFISISSINPIIIIYEQDLLNKSEGLMAKISKSFNLTKNQKEWIESNSTKAKQKHSRFNKGIAGRGRQLIHKSDLKKLNDLIKGYSYDLTADEKLFFFT